MTLPSNFSRGFTSETKYISKSKDTEGLGGLITSLRILGGFLAALKDMVKEKKTL